jgi:hypothetical protein
MVQQIGSMSLLHYADKHEGPQLTTNAKKKKQKKKISLFMKAKSSNI